MPEKRTSLARDGHSTRRSHSRHSAGVLQAHAQHKQASRRTQHQLRIDATMASSAALEPQVNIAGLTNASIGMATFSKGCLCPGDKRTEAAACQQQVQCNHSAWVVANAPQPGAAGQTRTSKPQHVGNRNSDKKTTQNIQTTSTAQSSQNGENKLYQTLLSPLPTGITARRAPPSLLWPTLNPAMRSNVVQNGSSPQMATAQAPTTFAAIKASQHAIHQPMPHDEHAACWS